MLEGLEEPYRTVLRLRFLEECTTEEIALRLERPEATVRSQVRRGLERVRARLSSEQRRERRFAWLHSWRLRAGSLAAAGIGALGLAGWWILADPRTPTVLTEGSIVSGPGTASALRTAAEPNSSRIDSISPGTSPIAPLATLEVRVLRADGRPAEGAVVAVADGQRYVERAVAGADGLARVDVYAADLGALGLPATRDRVSMRAERAGLAASSVLHVDPRSASGPQGLVLGGPGTIVSGTVIGPDGTPVEGARVSYVPSEDYIAPPTEGPFVGPARLDTRTDASGRFEFEGLDSRPARLRVAAPGLAERREPLWPGNAARLELELELDRGARVAGLVRDSQGRPASGAELFLEPHDRWSEWAVPVERFDLERFDALLRTRCDAEGRYRLSGVEPGPHTLWAVRGNEVARVRASLPSGSGLDWDPILEAVEPLRLHLVEGESATGERFVRLSSGPPEDHWLRVHRPDASGLVTVYDVAPGPVWVEVLDARLVRLLGRAGPLRPGPEVHEIVLADPRELGLVRGTLRDARGLPIGAVELKRYDPLSHNPAAIPVDPATGDFAGSFPAGRFVLGCVVDRRGLALGTYDLEPGGLLDLGALRLPATGTLVLLRGSMPALEREPASFRIAARYGPDLFRELQRGPWPPPQTRELFPGPHWLEVMAADGTVLFRASAEVRAGEEAWMDLP